MSSTQSEQHPPMDADDLIEEEEDKATNRSMSRAKSIAITEGFEGKSVVKDQYAGRSLGVFTSGGDAQGNYTINYLYIIYFNLGKLIFQKA